MIATMLTRLWKRFDEGLEQLVFDASWYRPRTAAVACLAGGLVLWGLLGTRAPEAQTAAPAADPVQDYLLERPWFDGYPVNPTPDKPYHVYLFTQDEGRGYFITLKSRYTQELEVFWYKLEKNRIQIYLPESKTKATGTVAIAGCKGPGDFDLKLTLGADPKNGGKAKDYYSWEHWGTALPEGLMLPELPASRLAPPPPEGF